MIELSGSLYKSADGKEPLPNSIELLIKALMRGPNEIENNEELNPRVPLQDEDLRNLLSKEVITIIKHYLPNFKYLFTKTYYINQNAGKILKKWNEIETSNLEVSVLCIVKLVKKHLIVPQLMNIETFHSLIQTIRPALNKHETEFYEVKNEIIVEYEKYNEFIENAITPRHNEPQLMLHEFILLMCKIAINFIKEKHDICIILY